MRTPDGYYSTRCTSHATDFVPVDEAPSVTFRIFVDRDEAGPRYDAGNAYDEGAP